MRSDYVFRLCDKNGFVKTNITFHDLSHNELLEQVKKHFSKYEFLELLQEELYFFVFRLMPGVAQQIKRPFITDFDHPDILARAKEYGLTLNELAVLRCVSLKMKDSEGACQLAIGYEAYRARIKSVHRKMRVSSSFVAVSMLRWGIPPEQLLD